MSVYLAGGCAVLMTAGLLIANEPILRMMNYSAEIMPEVKQYMGIIYAGLIVTAAYNSLAAFLRAIGDSKSPLYFLIISAVINVALDVVFIVVFGMGVEGCAYATVIAQAISALLCFIYIVKKFPILHLTKSDRKISFQSFGRLLSLGIPMGLQFSITAIGTIIDHGAVNVYSQTYKAVYTAEGILNQMNMTEHEKLLQFCEAVEAKKRSLMTVVEVSGKGSCIIREMETKNGDVKLIRNYYVYGDEKMELSSKDTYHAESWEYTEDGYLMFSRW